MDCSTAKSGSLSLLQKHIRNGSEDISEREGVLSVKLKSDSKASFGSCISLCIFFLTKPTASIKYGPLGNMLHLSTCPPYIASPAISARFPLNTS